MAKIVVKDQAVVLTSELTNGQLEKAQKFFKDALVLKKENKKGDEVTFGVIVYGGSPELTSYGAIFPKGAKEDKAALTLMVPKTAKKDIKTAVKETFGEGLRVVQAIEKQYKTREKVYEDAFAKLDEDITVE